MSEMAAAAEESFHSHMAGGRARRAGVVALDSPTSRSRSWTSRNTRPRSRSMRSSPSTAIHDQAKPAVVLRRIADALKPGGVFFMLDVYSSSNLEDNIGNPMASLIYGISTLHCMTVSLAQGGDGLGAAWGHQTATRMLTEAGLTGIEVHEVPDDPFNVVFLSRKR